MAILPSLQQLRFLCALAEQIKALSRQAVPDKRALALDHDTEAPPAR
jgi:hypothetical protein